jgi:hypothetical protein
MVSRKITRPAAARAAESKEATGPAEAAAEEAFHAGLLAMFEDSRIPFRVGGTCAVNAYIGLDRPTKDIDIFCRAGDHMRILAIARQAGHDIAVEDDRWIAKIRRGLYYCDVIFSSANLIAPVTDEWLEELHHAAVFGVDVKLLPPTELIWSKSFIMDRTRYDGADIAHLILKKHEHISWRRLLAYMDHHWEVLLGHVLNFRYIYPSDRTLIPEWLMDELLTRLALHRRMPLAKRKICRGRVFSRSDYLIDVTQWGYADLVGEEGDFAR